MQNVSKSTTEDSKDTAELERLRIDSIARDTTLDGHLDTVYSCGRALAETSLYTLAQFMPKVELNESVRLYNSVASIALKHDCFNVNLPGCIMLDSNGLVVFSFGFIESKDCRAFLDSVSLKNLNLVLVCDIDQAPKTEIDQLWHKPRRIRIEEL